MKRGVVAAMFLFAASAHAAPPGPIDQDWPCQQVKVPVLSVASVWNGPPIDTADRSWSNDPAIADLASRLAERRMAIEQAQQTITAFAEHLGANKQAKLVMLFAALFDVLGQERASVMTGLDRFGQRQKELAAQIRTELEALRAEQGAPEPDQAKLANLGQRLGWDTQVFNDRRQTLSYACQVPDTMAQRLFQLARTIQQLLQ